MEAITEAIQDLTKAICVIGIAISLTGLAVVIAIVFHR